MSFAVHNSHIRSVGQGYPRLQDNALGDQHPEWSGPDKGTHSTIGIACLFASATLVFYGMARLFGFIP